MRVLPLFVLLAPLQAQAAESPQRFALELKFGPYSPRLDDSPGLTRPVFSDLLGGPDLPRGERLPYSLLTQVEFDWQFLHRFGVLGVGVSGGYHRRSAPQLLYFPTPDGSLKTCSIVDEQLQGEDGQVRTYKGYRLPMGVDPAGKQLPDSCFSSDENILNVVPLSLMLVYRFDWLDKRFRVPLIPYMKVGLAYYLWWFGSSSEFVVSKQVDEAGRRVMDGLNGSGGTFGFVLHPGLAIDLGAIDRQAAYVMDREIGLNRVSAFVELHYARIDNFGSPAEREVDGKVGPSTLDLSDTTLNAGLSFEF